MITNERNLLLKKKAIAMAIASSLSTTTLTGCGNQTLFDTQYVFNKAIILSENSALIVEVDSWTDYEDGEQIQIKTKEGAVILTSSYDTKLIDDRNSTVTAEDIARGILGEDVEITYLSETANKSR